MRLVDVLLRDTRWSREDQETPYNPGAEFDKAMLETCEPADRPAHQLQLMLVSELGRFTRDEIFALIPIGMGRWAEDDLMPDPEHRIRHHELRELFDATFERYRSRLRQTLGSSEEGWINRHSAAEVTVQPGQRRHPRPSEQEIGVGLYYLQEKSPSPWHWHEADAGFYPTCVAPHFKDDHEDDPFQWAAKRMKIVHGYGVECCGRDYAPDFMEYPYQQMASQVCNSLPDSLRESRTYRLDASKRTCMEAALALCPLPEAAMIALELPAACTEETLKNPPAPEFFGKLKVMLGNGLIVDRFVACVRGQATFLGAPEALAYAMRLTMAIYAGDSTGLVSRGDPPVDGTQRPWWFKEDIDLIEPFDPDRPSSAGGSASQVERLQIPCDDQGRALQLGIAEQSSFAYRNTLEAYRRAGHRLATLEGVGQECAIHCTAEVVKGFGIGNVPRAERILTLALTLAEEAPPPLRAEILSKRFLPFIEGQQPSSTIISALEGDNVSVHLPGLSALMYMVLGEERMRAEGISAVTIKPAQIQDAMRTFASAPLLTRARLALPLDGTMHRGLDNPIRLLPNAANGRQQLALPAPDGSAPVPDAVNKPVWTIMDFYAQLRRECSYDDRYVAELYFAFCAPKMRDPLKPPEGFLALLKAYKGIPDERVQHEMFAHPYDRRSVAQRNARFRVDRMMALSHLLDAFAMGIVTEEEMLGTLQWLTTRADKETEVECAWEAYENFGAKYAEGEHPSYFESDDQELEWETRRRIEEEAGSDHSARLITFKERTAKVLLLQTLVSAGAFRAHELRQSMRDCLLFWQRPDVSWYPPIAEIGLELNEDIATLGECLKAGIVDRVALLAAIQERSTTGDRLSDLIAVFPAMHEDLRASHARVETVLGEIVSSGALLTSDDRSIEQKFTALHAELSGRWKNRRFASVDVIDRLLANVKLEKIVHVAAMRRYGSDITPGIDARRIPANMRDISTANLHALRLLPILSHQLTSRQQLLETANLRRALPAPQSDEQAPPSAGGALIPIEHIWTSVEEHYVSLLRQLPMARRQVRAWRQQARGLLPVGGKLHVEKAFDSAHIGLLHSMLGYSSGYFHLIHAGDSLLLPPCPSVEELQCAIAILVQEGVISDDRPELQMGLPGRITPDRCGYLGATCLLATQWTTRFTAESFCTTHDHATGARMIAYDAGAPNAAYPFMARTGDDEENLEGRTDVLGRRHPGDAEIIQLIGTILIDEQVGGPFGPIGKEFMERLRAILKRYGIGKTLEAPWVFTSEEDKYSKDNAPNIQHFEEAVKPCQDAYFACAEKYHRLAEAMGPEQAPQDGIIFDVRRLLDWIREQVNDNRPTVIDADPKWHDHLEVLLTV
ncbi:MAG: hypothetical protein PHH13_01325 [Candidatus Peribacteraceae bacterium]|nr:hypothetical protein [Candidatus Peribacteraceae bacterium]